MKLVSAGFVRTRPAQSASVEDACSGCGGAYRFDTSIPSVQWNAVIRSAGLPDFLCTACIVRAFVKAGVSFVATLSGDGFHGDTIEVRVNGAESSALHELEDENNRLRVALRERDASAVDAYCRPPDPAPGLREAMLAEEEGA